MGIISEMDLFLEVGHEVRITMVHNNEVEEYCGVLYKTKTSNSNEYIFGVSGTKPISNIHAFDIISIERLKS